jgi:hypothetical protein
MEKISENINRFLPYGESLRTILQHPSISRYDKIQLLRIKGIFVVDGDDETTFPLLTTSLLSPFEFEFLREKLQTKEDREKTLTRTMDWDSSENLITALPENFNIQDIVKTTYPRYRIVGTPNFSMIDNNPNRVILKFKCETENYSKEWYRAKNEFKGQVAFEKITTNDNKVRLEIVHTSPETTDISNKVVKHLENHFKANNYINAKSEIQKILYKNFSNEDRMKFLLSFTEGNNVFNFEKASFLNIGPDPTEVLPDNINWLELAKVRELNINGEGLHNIHFIRDKALHKYMESCEMEILYNFSIPAAEGNCTIHFGFPGFLPKRLSNIEFEVDIKKISLADAYSQVPLTSVKTILRKEFEKFKTEKFESLYSK